MMLMAIICVWNQIPTVRLNKSKSLNDVIVNPPHPYPSNICHYHTQLLELIYYPDFMDDVIVMSISTVLKYHIHVREHQKQK